MTTALTAEQLRAPLELELPIRTRNELNVASHEHWRFRQKRAKDQRLATALAVRPHAYRLRGMYPLVVTCTRVTFSNGLDAHDGLPSAFKAVVDGLCDALGINDRDSRISFKYAQRRGARGYAGIELRIEEA